MSFVLVVFVHPAVRRSRLNRSLRDAVRDLEGVRVHDLYETYPDFFIDVAAEQAVLREAGALVVQHPIYWYSCPALLKEWFDLVWQQGFAFGPGERALAGKPWVSAVSTGSQPGAYHPEGLHRFTLEEILRPFEATARLCGMTWQDPFVTHDAVGVSAEVVREIGQAYRRRLEALRDALKGP
ncbi:NAD(P)H-dependent oxidoreductase [Pararhodospirillum photometricum]|uniref:Glutathione-regulated potassium-efflux system ancillary protein KefG n=1 Tax=Pararhodospirillum photometricum DSM 122 TaxID=1150469 RepID=H6SLY0_PARPM|nr:NAD(P)H-dependent oxidoreductase [Pararhodospirillum photometricum]CCG08995.1 Glutathione-regulated potassium-efflux system ancillary protein KefG [Pararhodospirillum photometricum DSM 122]